MLVETAPAQVLYGSIVGSVADASGAGVPDATVIAINKETGQQRQTSSQQADQVGEVKQLGGYRRGQAYYDYRAFKPVTDKRFGTAGLDILRGPAIRNLDIGLFRRFTVTERVNVQFRAEALNFTNTPQLANPSGNISSLRTDPSGNFLGGVFEVTGTANTGRDGLVQRALRFGVRIGF